jgi:transposase
MVTIETLLIEPKKDERGRKITPRAEWEGWVKAYRESGLTQRAFAQKERINYTTFVAWVQEFSSRGAAAIKFAEVSAPPCTKPVGLEAQLPGGKTVRGEAVELARLLQLLRCLTFPSALRIYLAVEPVDMRKQFNGLWSLAQDKLSENPRNGAVFVFVNKDKDRLKMLYWDGTGPGFFAKRLERGRFTSGGKRSETVVPSAGSFDDAPCGDRFKGWVQKGLVRTLKKLDKTGRCIH